MKCSSKIVENLKILKGALQDGYVIHRHTKEKQELSGICSAAYLLMMSDFYTHDDFRDIIELTKHERPTALKHTYYWLKGLGNPKVLWWWKPYDMGIRVKFIDRLIRLHDKTNK